MKKIINVAIGFLMYGIEGGMERNSMSIKDGLIALILLILFLCLINRKKSATSRPRNGQVHYKHTKLNHHKFTPYKGGMSSVL